MSISEWTGQVGPRVCDPGTSAGVRGKASPAPPHAAAWPRVTRGRKTSSASRDIVTCPSPGQLPTQDWKMFSGSDSS